MTKVIQYNDFSCFAACLESFLKDNNRPFDHQKFILANLDVFHGGETIEGSCDSDSFAEVAKRIGLGFEHIQEFSKSKGITFSEPKETILFATYWQGEKSDKHCVRYYTEERGKWKVMNPKTGDFDYLDEDWIFRVYRVSAA